MTFKVSKKELEILADGLIVMFGDEAPNEAEAVAKEKADAGAEDAEKFWRLLRQTILEIQQ